MTTSHEIIIIQTYDTYMIAAPLYDRLGTETIDSFQAISKAPVCYLFYNPIQLQLISKPIKLRYFKWQDIHKKPIYMKLNASETHTQMTGEKTIIAYYLTASHFKESGRYLGLLRAVSLPKVEGLTTDEKLNQLFQSYQHVAQTIYATDEIAPTNDFIPIIDFTKSQPVILRQGDISLDGFPDLS